jgi:hypothetical protein
MRFKRILLLILCAAFAFGAPLAGAHALEQPCAMTDADPGAAPCGGCDDAASSGCGTACVLAFSGTMVVSTAATPGIDQVADRVLGDPPPHFASLTGPPVLQPPR